MLVLIQHDVSTGRYHPAYYLLAPFPGELTSPTRYKSKAHHPEGFHDLPSARAHAEELASQLGLEQSYFEVRERPEAGPDIVLRAAPPESQ